MTCETCKGSGYVGGGNGNDGADRCPEDCMTDLERAMSGALPRLPAEKLEAFTLDCVRALRVIEGDAWAPEPTLLGWDFVEVELVGVVPRAEI